MYRHTIRPARNEDGPAITALIYEILHEYGLPPDPENTDQGLDRVEDFFDLFEVIEVPGKGIIATLGLISRDPRGILRQAQDEVSSELPAHGRAATAAPATIRRPAGGIREANCREAKEGILRQAQDEVSSELPAHGRAATAAPATIRRLAGGIREANCREAKEGILRQAQDEVSSELPAHGRAATAAPATIRRPAGGIREANCREAKEGILRQAQDEVSSELPAHGRAATAAPATIRRPAGGIREANCREAKEGKTCELVKMFVHSSQRGKGLGQFLLDRAMEQAKLMGFTVMELETASVLKEAIGLYRKAGFEQTESGPHAKRCDITMVRTL
jgi:GNAT superfamily N-acetyltransferase